MDERVEADHLVYAAPELEPAVSRVEALLGVGAVAGGRHPGKGTRNALISFSDERYLEIVAPDPDQPDPEAARWFGIDGLDAPRLVTWCARAPDVEAAARRAAAAGVELGAVSEGGRLRPDGRELRWRVTDPGAPRLDGTVPFLIDWLDSPHPAAGGGACRLVGLRVRHPSPDAVAQALAALGVALEVGRGTVPELVAVVDTPSGPVELR